MSAFLVHENHIGALVRFYLERERPPYLCGLGLADPEDVDLMRLLWDENARSLRARYGDRGDIPAPVFSSARYYARLAPVEAIKACHCLDYQSCETDDWDTTKACLLLRRIEGAAERLLPGYDAADWEITRKAPIA